MPNPKPSSLNLVPKCHLSMFLEHKVRAEFGIGEVLEVQYYSNTGHTGTQGSLEEVALG